MKRQNYMCGCGYILIVILILTTCNSFLWASDQDIIPKPQKTIIKSPAFRYLLSDQWVIAFSKTDSAKNQYQFIANELANDLNSRGLNLSIVDLDQVQNFSKTILLGDPNTNAKIAQQCLKHGIQMDHLPYSREDSRYNECYILDIDSESPFGLEGIVIVGQGPAGVYYGSRTLLQLINSQNEVSGVQIVDYPDSKWRGAYLMFKHMQCLGLENRSSRSIDAETLGCISQIIKGYADLKINRLIFRGNELYNLDKDSLYFLTRLFDECRNRFIEPIPSIESKLENLPPFRTGNLIDLNTLKHIEGVYIDQEPFFVGDDFFLVAEKPLTNLVENSSFDMDRDLDLFPDHWKISALTPSNGWKWVKKKQTGISGQEGKPETSTDMVIEMNFSKGDTSLYQISQDITVTPQSYYELSFLGCGGAPVVAKIIQFDKTGNTIPFVSYQRTINLNQKWQKYSLPVFSDKSCQIFRVIFEPLSGGKKAGTIYLDELELFRMNSSLVNVINSPESQIRMVSASGDLSYIQDKDFIVSFEEVSTTPQRSIKSISPTKIKITNQSGLKKDQRVLLSYDCVTLNPREENSKRCPSASGTYQEYRQLLSNLLSLSPKYVNINMDEHRGGFNRDSRCLERKMENSEIYAEFINTIDNILHKEEGVQLPSGITISGLGRPEIRLILWDDMVSYWHNGGQERGQYYQLRYGGKKGSTYLAMPETPFNNDKTSIESRIHIQKDVILGVWWYEKKDTWEKMARSVEYFESRGFDYFVCPWDKEENIDAWSRQIYQKKSLGIMATTFEERKSGIRSAANYAWHNIMK